MEQLVTAVKRWRAAKKAHGSGFCGQCALVEVRGRGPYCWTHEATGDEMDAAFAEVIAAVEALVPDEE